MRKVTIATGLMVLGIVCGAAQAQFDSSVWPGYRGTGTKRASVSADGPAINLAFELDNFANMSAGGFTIAANGDIYFKTYKPAGSEVYRLNPADGSVLAMSVDLGGGPGNYGGVAVGVDAVYTCVYDGAFVTSIVKLDKNTLAVIDTFTDPVFGGLRGTPLISDKPNAAGNHNLFIADRNEREIYAIDSVTGAIQWSYDPIYDVVLGQMGPMWILPDNRQAFAYFGNGTLGSGAALADNGDGTFEVLWDATGPESFNWFGSGTLSADGERIYVTTFNDGDTSSLWTVSAADGSILWHVPGLKGDPLVELNFFSRPSARGDEVYCVGAFGVVVSFTDNKTSYTKNWEFREGEAEFTAGSVVELANGDRYVYAIAQDPARLVVLKDEGASYTKVLDTDLGGTMRWTFLGSNSATIDADGSLWVSGGRYDDAEPGDIYKFTVEAGCPCACDFDTSTGFICDIFDFLAFQNGFVAGDPCACDIDLSTGPGICDIFDFLAFQGEFVGECP